MLRCALLLKIRCAAILILGVLAAVNGLQCYKGCKGSNCDAASGTATETKETCSISTDICFVASSGVQGGPNIKGCSIKTTQCKKFTDEGGQCFECTTDLCNTAPIPDPPAAFSGTAAGAAVTTPTAGCFANSGDTQKIANCNCHSTCKKCGYNTEPNGVNDCVTCMDSTHKITAVYTDGTGFCSAAAMLQAGTVVSALLAFVVALASA
jgi:hypothetical protein